MNKSVLVTKASGDKVAFLSEKLYTSLKRSGASDEAINKVIDQVQSQLYDGITTREIFRIAFSLMKKLSKHSASRYKLKQAIRELGPTGFPFELFISELLKAQQFHTNVGVIVNGHCVSHEVDVIAEKDGNAFMIECKFHNSPGIKCDVKVPLYIHSRFNDIVQFAEDNPATGRKFDKGWVVTNTHFTDDAIQYGTCSGLVLLGWDYPRYKGIKDLIDKYRLYPLTCLTSISKHEKQLLLERKLLLCRDILANENILQSAGIHESRIQLIKKDCLSLINR